MKALILNSGIGSRMGDFTKERHKSMIEIHPKTPLIFMQMDALINLGIHEFIITTGHLAEELKKMIADQYGRNVRLVFAYNPLYRETNYIYSIYRALDFLLEDDLLILHGDLYFEEQVLTSVYARAESCVVIDTAAPVPEKDFKANIIDGKVSKIATYIHDECFACQPLYHFKREDFKIWAEKIAAFCENGKICVYAEEALNEVLHEIDLFPHDIKGKICMEIDSMDDLGILKHKIKRTDGYA